LLYLPDQPPAGSLRVREFERWTRIEANRKVHNA